MHTIITKATAQAGSLTHYFTGQPCSRGHIAARQVSDRACTGCKLEAGRKWRAGNRQKSREQGRISDAKRAGASLLYKRDWRTLYPARSVEQMRSAKALAINRRPAWYSRPACVAVYQRAHDLTAATGIAHEVDHVVPLKGELVSGLHVAENLQVLTRADNIAKGNSFTP